MGTEWIHVVTATKLPKIRTGNSPFEVFASGMDPNVDTPFGPDKETMFLPVVREDSPTFNAVTEKLLALTTVGDDDGTYEGQYQDPSWVIGWTVVPQDLEVSKDVKIGQLEADRDTHVSAGYPVGPFVFPLTEHFFRLLADRLRWLEDAIAALEVPANTRLTFSDLADKEVSVGVDTLKNHFVLFGKAYLGTYEKEVRAREEIKAAADVNAVDAVTWSF